jgi:glyceraldehyde 3-phosphate dehydrogenase
MVLHYVSPVSNGSIADIVLTLNNEVTKEEINKVLKEASQSYLKGILSYTEEQYWYFGFF